MNRSYYFCKIFIDTDVQYEELYQAIIEMVDGKAEMRNNIKNETIDISLIRNKDFNATKRYDFPDGFVYSRYFLEVEPKPNENLEFHSYTMSVSLLLERLWTKGISAVAACDFEELLPRKGGFNYR